MLYESKFGFQNRIGPIDLQALATFEETLPSKKLPIEYREFLVEWNGGIFEESDVGVEVPEDPYYPFRISELYGVSLNPVGLTLQKAETGYGFRDATPRDYIPIGDAGGWDTLALAVAGRNVGKVYCWRPGEPWPQKEQTEDLLTFLCADFREFWNGLKIVEW